MIKDTKMAIIKLVRIFLMLKKIMQISSIVKKNYRRLKWKIILGTSIKIKYEMVLFF